MPQSYLSSYIISAIGNLKAKQRTTNQTKATSNNWFRSENEDLRMDGKDSEVSSIG